MATKRTKAEPEFPKYPEAEGDHGFTGLALLAWKRQRQAQIDLIEHDHWRTSKNAKERGWFVLLKVARNACPCPRNFGEGGNAPVRYGFPVCRMARKTRSIRGEPVRGEPVGTDLSGRTCPGRTCPGRTCPGRTCPGEPVPGEPVPGGPVPGEPVRGEPVRANLSRADLSRANLSRANLSWRTCPGRTCSGRGRSNADT